MHIVLQPMGCNFNIDQIYHFIVNKRYISSQNKLYRPAICYLSSKSEKSSDLVIAALSSSYVT